MIWLGGQLPDNKQFKFSKPGAFHPARFMSKAIYLLKMDLLSERIPFVDPQQRLLVRRMATFIGLFYARHFLRSRIACFAPLDDFEFYCHMVDFKEEDDEIASAVLDSMSRHLW